QKLVWLVATEQAARVDPACIGEQVQEDEGEEEGADYKLRAADGMDAEAMLYDGSDAGEVAPVEPEVVDVFVYNQQLGWNPQGDCPLPASHDGLTGAEYADHAVATAGQSSDKLAATAESVDAVDADDRTAGGVEAGRLSGV